MLDMQGSKVFPKVMLKSHCVLGNHFSLMSLGNLFAIFVLLFWGELITRVFNVNTFCWKDTICLPLQNSQALTVFYCMLNHVIYAVRF